MIHKFQTKGLGDKQSKFWGAIGNDELQGVLMLDRRDEKLYGYLDGKNKNSLKHLGQLVKRRGASVIAGEKSKIEVAMSSFKSNAYINFKQLSLVKIEPEQFVKHYEYKVRLAEKKDIPLLVKIYRDLEYKQKNRTDNKIKREIQNIMNSSGKYFMVERDGLAVCASRIYPETKKAGVISASRTLPEFRGFEIYLSVRTACMEYLFNQGKIGISFIEESNPSIRRILDKQGGSVTAKWLAAKIRKRSSALMIIPNLIQRWIWVTKRTIHKKI